MPFARRPHPAREQAAAGRRGRRNGQREGANAGDPGANRRIEPVAAVTDAAAAENADPRETAMDGGERARPRPPKAAAAGTAAVAPPPRGPGDERRREPRGAPPRQGRHGCRRKAAARMDAGDRTIRA